MKPSSKICLLGIMALASFWPAAGEAGAAGRSFSMPTTMHFRPMARSIVRSGHVGAVAGLHARSLRGGAFAYGSGLPVYWDGTLPAYAPGYGSGADYASAAAEGQVPPSPIFYSFYPPPGAGPLAACAAPLVIKIAPSKPSHKLPRVVYGTPSLCQG